MALAGADEQAAEQLALDLDDDGGVALPRLLEPMRVRLANEPFDSPDYLFETRWNGIRALASLENGQVRVYNRRVGDVTARFPELQLLRSAAADQPLLLDGEIVIVDDHGRPDFDGLQWRIRQVDEQSSLAEAQRRPACFLASDVLFYGRRWLLDEQLVRRKRLLAEAVHQAGCVYLSEFFEAEGGALFQAALESELEGILAKPRTSPYTPGGYGGQWLAIGHGREQFVIGGYSMQIAGRSRTIELLIGAHDSEGRLKFVSSVPPPSNEKIRGELLAVLNALQVDQSPFVEVPPFIACWVRPEVVVTVSFSRRGGQNESRYPVFERVRFDVSPDECLLPVDAPPADSFQPASGRPKLTMLTTLPLPFEAPAVSALRPLLRVIGQGD